MHSDNWLQHAEEGVEVELLKNFTKAPKSQHQESWGGGGGEEVDEDANNIKYRV